MKKQFLILLVGILVMGSTQAQQTKKFSEKLAGVILNGKVGFIDRKNRFIIPPKFDAVKDLQSFSQGLAVVCVNGKYGFINKRGEFVIEPIYEWADNFRGNQLASVKQGGKYELTNHISFILTK